MNNPLAHMLLIENVETVKLYKVFMELTKDFLVFGFALSIILKFITDLNFFEPLKKIVVITLFMSCFFTLHTEGSKLSMDIAYKTLKKVSPRNLYLKKWTQVKMKTKTDKKWGILERFIVPNLNDLVSTLFFILSKAFMWILKLSYSTIYHFTYIFAGLAAILYFFDFTKDALKGIVRSSLWCITFPFVVIAVFILVGKSVEEKALNSELLVSDIDTLIWLFGVNLLLLIAPVLTFSFLNGDGMGVAANSLVKYSLRSGDIFLRSFSVANDMRQGTKSLLKSAQRYGGKKFNQISNLAKSASNFSTISNKSGNISSQMKYSGNGYKNNYQTKPEVRSNKTIKINESRTKANTERSIQSLHTKTNTNAQKQVNKNSNSEKRIVINRRDR